MFGRKSFEDKVTNILMRKDFDQMYENMLFDSMKMFKDYGVHEKLLLNNLKDLQAINEVTYYHSDDNLAKNVEFINEKKNDVQININVDNSTGMSDRYGYHLEKCEQLTQLSRGIVDSLVRKEGEIGVEHNNDILGIYVKNYLAEEVSSFANSAANYYSNDNKYSVLSDHIDLLMKIDGKNLIINYLNDNEKIFYNSDYQKLNDALSNLNVINSLDSLDGEVYNFNDRLFVDVKQLDDFNKAYCEYIGDKIKDLSKEEIDFYKSQIISLPSMSDEHLKILENPKEISFDKEGYLNDKINDILNENGSFNERERKTITDIVMKFSEYGIDEDVLLKNLKGLERVNYVSFKDMDDGFSFFKKKEVEFTNKGRIFFGKDNNVEINVRIYSEYEAENYFCRAVDNWPNLKKNKEFAEAMVNALSNKDCFSVRNNLGMQKVYYELSMENHLEKLKHYAVHYVANDLLRNNIGLYDVTMEHPDPRVEKMLVYNFERSIIHNEHQKLFDVLLDVNKSLIKEHFEHNIDYENYSYLKRLNDSYGNTENFNRVLCEYVGFSSKDLSNEEFTNIRGKISSFEEITDEHLKILDETRENYIKNDKILESLNDKNKDNNLELD